MVETLVRFGHELRAAGVKVGSGQVVAWCEAVAQLDPADADDVYWSGRACLLTRREDTVLYDLLFDRFLRGAGNELRLEAEGTPPPGQAQALHLGALRPAEGDGEAGAIASSVELLRRKPFSQCTPEELETLRTLLARMDVTTPQRPSRRTRRDRRGSRPDMRRALRRSLRADGDIARLDWRRRRIRPRPLVLLLDVSGSMADYSRALLQFAHVTARGRGRVEVFCFGTRLTRVSGALARRNPDAALVEAAEQVVDWDGGTRIGDCIREFVRGFGRAGLARGAVVVICSDGLERGDPERLAVEMERLRRLAHRVVWVNPLKGDPAYEPLARGMKAALPHVDVFLPGHDMSSLEALARLLPELR